MIWAVEVVLALVFLCWFGNIMAAKYRRMYGELPDVRPEPIYRETEPQAYEVYESGPMCTSVCSSVVTTPFYGYKAMNFR